ncbi:MAG: DUF899 family protein [Nitrosopumilaceae archaeon]
MTAQKLHKNTFPNESDEYRRARNKLLVAEINLRKQLSGVTNLRMKLPSGGKLKEDYTFDEIKNGKTSKTKFSNLFQDKKNSLIIYSMMYDPKWSEACPYCTSILDGLEGSAHNVNVQTNFIVVSKAPIQKLQAWKKKRGWNNLRLLSSFNNSYNKDYFAEDSNSEQIPALNVFQKTPKGIFHFYNTELLYAPPEKGQDARHVDLIWPIWNLFDLTPQGRGKWVADNSRPRKKDIH